MTAYSSSRGRSFVIWALVLPFTNFFQAERTGHGLSRCPLRNLVRNELNFVAAQAAVKIIGLQRIKLNEISQCDSDVEMIRFEGEEKLHLKMEIQEPKERIKSAHNLTTRLRLK